MSSRDQELLIPTNVRTLVIERDGHCCRMCGTWTEIPHVHHIIYRSQGGKDLPTNLVSLDLYCHERVHRNKPVWMPVLQQVALTDGVNALALLRWYEARG
jgi:5-methylcytosine-specific restriction endonuclease McrA